MERIRRRQKQKFNLQRFSKFLDQMATLVSCIVQHEGNGEASGVRHNFFQQDANALGVNIALVGDRDQGMVGGM